MARLPLAEFDFKFPPELIAVEPAEPRDSSRLLVLDRGPGARAHARFMDLPKFLRPGDCVVVNKTKVVPARAVGRKPTGGKIELVFLREAEPGVWACLGPGLKPGTRFELEGGAHAEVAGVGPEHELLCRFDVEVLPYLRSNGLPPLPPYILKRRKTLNLDGAAKDRERYQTVYARQEGSVAAPTAGLHFTPQVLGDLEKRGIAVAELTLHVGWGTFRPIESEDADQHRMLPEQYVLAPEQAALIKSAKRVIAVGTSACRTLETLARRPEGFGPGEGWTDLYIRPGHEFKIIGALVTNFHQPCSTPLMLASAFAGKDRLLEAYREAIEMKYRLFSYGDSMLIL